MIDGSHLAAAAKTDPLEDAIDPRHVLARVFLEPKAIESLRALAPLSLITYDDGSEVIISYLDDLSLV